MNILISVPILFSLKHSLYFSLIKYADTFFLGIKKHFQILVVLFIIVVVVIIILFIFKLLIIKSVFALEK